MKLFLQKQAARRIWPNSGQQELGGVLEGLETSVLDHNALQKSVLQDPSPLEIPMGSKTGSVEPLFSHW